MVTTQQEHIVWKLQFLREQESYNFGSILTSINVVTEEKQLTVVLAWLAELPQHGKHVEVLTVNISNDYNFAFDT